MHGKIKKIRIGNGYYLFKLEKILSDRNISINQLEISEIVEARLREILKLSKKQINLLTNKEIRYIIVTGGITEIAGFQYLVENVCQGTNLDKEEVYKAVIKREQGISTTLDTGLSIPHARMEGLDSFKAAIAIIPEGIKDDFGLQIKAMFLFVSPSGEQYFPEHLKLLAKLAENFTSAFIDELCKLSKAEDIVAKLPF